MYFNYIPISACIWNFVPPQLVIYRYLNLFKRIYEYIDIVGVNAEKDISIAM